MQTSTSRGLLGVVVAWFLVLVLFATAWIVHGVSSHSAPAAIKGVQHSGRPLRVLLVGDSMAGTLGMGLAKAAPASNVELLNGALGGCGVAIAYDDGWASGIWIPQAPIAPCRSKQEIHAYWLGLLRKFSPDVVIYLSRMDTVDQEVKPRSSSMIGILQPSFDAYLTSSLTDAVHVLSSDGAHVILGTSPPTLFNLQGNLYDDPARWTQYRQILSNVATSSNGVATTFDLTSFFGGSSKSPSFQLESKQGIRWRCGDGIHFNVQAGIAVAPDLFAEAWRVGGERVRSDPNVPAILSDLVNRAWGPYAAQAAAMRCGS
jgi:SGNH domain (fused to AT3 domains)